MNIKQEVINSMVIMLEKELHKINDTIRSNTFIINNHGRENTLLKRKRVEINRLITSFRGKKT